MSGSNGSAAGLITLDELERLIKLLGMLGSESDGEVLNAAKLAQRWVVAKGSDWRTLLTPEPEAGVVSVGVAITENDVLHREDIAYGAGYQAGLKEARKELAAQAKAQAFTQQHGTPPGSAWINPGTQPFHQAWVSTPVSRPGAAQAAPGVGGGMQGAASGAGPVRASAAPPAGGWPTGTWQWVCAELLARHAAVPGVLRSREEIFVSDVLKRGFATLTPAQEHWLRDIAGRNGMSW